MVVRVNQCCCGCSLRTGAIIIGVLSLLGALGSITSASIALVNVDAVISALQSAASDRNSHEPSGNRDGTGWPLSSGGSTVDVAAIVIIALDHIRCIIIIALVLVVPAAIMSLFLLNGAISKRAGHLKPWLVWNTIFVALGVLFNIGSAAIFGRLDIAVFTLGPPYILLIGLVSTLIQVYFLIVVYSYYCELRDEKEVRSRMQYAVQKGGMT